MSTVLSLVFAEGQRPTAADIVRLSQNGPGPEQGLDQRFGVSHVAPAQDGWVELLAMGLTFDCRGLAPTAAADLPPAGSLIGLESYPSGEAIALVPGPHLTAGASLLPVVRMLAGLGAALAALTGIRAVHWGPAASWCAPAYFRDVIGQWLHGGAFPALGLTALKREANGAMVSQGLCLFTGQEIYLEPGARLSAAAMARIATRLIHQLVASGPIAQACEFAGPEGERLLAVPVRDGRQVRVMVSS